MDFEIISDDGALFSVREIGTNHISFADTNWRKVANWAWDHGARSVRMAYPLQWNEASDEAEWKKNTRHR